jgi:hypothetical protein
VRYGLDNLHLLAGAGKNRANRERCVPADIGQIGDITEVANVTRRDGKLREVTDDIDLKIAAFSQYATQHFVQQQQASLIELVATGVIHISARDGRNMHRNPFDPRVAQMLAQPGLLASRDRDDGVVLIVDGELFVVRLEPFAPLQVNIEQVAELTGLQIALSAAQGPHSSGCSPRTGHAFR